MSESNPFFDSINSILNGEYWMLDEYLEKQYNPIGVNKGLSQHHDAILHVNEVNQYWRVLSNKMHYDYLFRSIHKMKRSYKKWAKRDKDEFISIVMEYYKVNEIKARDYLAVLTEDNIKVIKEQLERGTT